MKIIDIVNSLNALAIVHSVSNQADWTAKTTIWGMQLVIIPFLRIYENGVLSPDSIEVAVESKGTEQEQVFWWKAIPSLLRENTTPVQTRDQFYNDTVYKAGIEAEFPGWKILKLNIQIDGDFDIANITAVHPTEDVIVFKRLMIWMVDGAPTWKWIEEAQTV